MPTQPPEPPKRSRGAHILLTAASALTAGALVLVYVFPSLPPAARVGLWALQFALLAAFVGQRTAHVLGATQPRIQLAARWMDLAVLGAAAALLAAGLTVGGRIFVAGAMYLLLSRAWRLVPRRHLGLALNILLAATGAVAVAALVLEYGFRKPPVAVEVLHAVQTVVVAMFILDRLVRLESAPSRAAYLRDNWVDFALLAAAAVAFIVGPRLHGKVLSAGAIYVIITQAYILVSLVLRGVSVNLDFAGSGAHPTWLLIGSFAALCLAGSGLLMLPAAVPPDAEPLYYVDALFTATSATCVTGLVVRDTGRDFTLFGQAVILGLIQLGGLGIMLFGTALALLVGKGLSVRSSDALGQMIGTEGIGRLARIAKFVVAVTIGVEIVGAALLYPMFAAPQGGRVPSTGQAVWDSVFHSISSFCNAGFSLYGQNMMAGTRQGWAQPFREHWQVLGVMAPLIVLGGLGFPVIEDCTRYVRRLLGRRRRSASRSDPARSGPRPRLSLHSKIVLSTSGCLIVLGTAGLLLLGPTRQSEKSRIGRVPIHQPDRQVRDDPVRWRNLSAGRKVREALFQSITARTAGFNTIDMRHDLTDAGRLLMCGLMIVGGSPASTAGGVKTVTVAVLLLATWSMVRRRNAVEAFRRSIAAVLLRRAVTLGVLYLGLLAAVTLLLCVAMPGEDFMRLLFEACSACGTVGLSTGITSALTHFARVVVTVAMFAGRLGPLTLLLALTAKMRHVKYSYPSEDVVIG